jgi:hypothetical protein
MPAALVRHVQARAGDACEYCLLPQASQEASLLKELAHRGCDIWVYTSSERSSHYVRLWFWLAGVALGGIVNQSIHNQVVRDGYPFPSLTPTKYPPAFGIVLHVDDSEGVAQDGAEHGFDVVLISPSDPEWATRVLEAISIRKAA